jgi:hypothetical protein
MKREKLLKVMIGLVLPYIGVLGPLPWIASTDRFVLGVPLIYGWLFLWFFLTSACMWVCWRFFDRPKSL